MVTKNFMLQCMLGWYPLYKQNKLCKTPSMLCGMKKLCSWIVWLFSWICRLLFAFIFYVSFELTFFQIWCYLFLDCHHVEIHWLILDVSLCLTDVIVKHIFGNDEFKKSISLTSTRVFKLKLFKAISFPYDVSFLPWYFYSNIL